MDSKTTSLWSTHDPIDMSNQGSLWPGWETVGMIGRGSFGAVYEIQRDVLGDIEKAALKVISIPPNSSDIEEMYNDGYDAESITSTFQSHLKNIVAEYSLMRKLNGCSNIVNCDDMRYIQHDDGIGWDVFIKMELLTPLAKSLPEKIPETTVVQLAKDMCAALVLCKKYEIVHRDIKPQNIFISENGDYKLGDFGVAKTVEKTMGGTKIGTYKYMPPEVYNNQPYGAAADIYSLGLVLYWMLNERRLPFLPLPPEKLKAGMEEHARNRRFAGDPLPPPVYGSDKLKRIVLKACAFDPKDRYASAAEMLQDLQNSFADQPQIIIDPLHKQKEEAEQMRRQKEAMEKARKEQEEAEHLRRAQAAQHPVPPVPATPRPQTPPQTHAVPQSQTPQKPQNTQAPRKPKKKSPVLPVIIICVVLAVCAALVFFVLKFHQNAVEQKLEEYLSKGDYYSGYMYLRNMSKSMDSDFVIESATAMMEGSIPGLYEGYSKETGWYTYVYIPAKGDPAYEKNCFYAFNYPKPLGSYGVLNFCQKYAICKIQHDGFTLADYDSLLSGKGQSGPEGVFTFDSETDPECHFKSADMLYYDFETDTLRIDNSPVLSRMDESISDDLDGSSDGNTGENTDNSGAAAQPENTPSTEIDQSPEAEDIPNQSDDTFRIFMSNAYHTSPYGSMQSQGILDTCESEGYEVVIADGEYSTDLQLNQFQFAAADDYDAFIYCPVDSYSAAPVIEFLNSTGLPWVMVNNTPTSDLFYECTSVAYDFVQIGRELGNLAVRYYEEHGYEPLNIAYIEGDPNYLYTVNITAGFYEVIDAYPDIRILNEPMYCNFDPAQAMTIMEDLITYYGNDIDLVLTQDANALHGAYNAIEAAGMLDMYDIACIGQAAFVKDLLLSGELYATVSEDPYWEGYYAIMALIMKVNGEAYDPWYSAPVASIYAEDIDNYSWF